jgi:hypothetical protein
MLPFTRSLSLGIAKPIVLPTHATDTHISLRNTRSAHSCVKQGQLTERPYHV